MARVLEFQRKEKVPAEAPKKPLLKRLGEKFHKFMENRRMDKENEKKIAVDSARMEFRTAKILVTIDYGSDELIDIVEMTHLQPEVVYSELLNLTVKGIVKKERGRYRLSKYGEKLVDKLMEEDDVSEYAERYEVV